MSKNTSFSELRKSSANLQTLSKAVKENKERKSYQDDRIWQMTIDKKTGAGSAKIRFLPASQGEEHPWVQMWSHAFQGETGKWFIHNCPTTKGHDHPCPVCEENSKLWKAGGEENERIARSRKRKLQYYSNILVIEDKANPENEGKVFIFKYGKKIFDKISAKLAPEYDDMTPVNVFDYWEGAVFTMRSKIKDKFITYEDFEFGNPTALFDGDETRLEELWGKQYKLQELVNDAQFKTYDELKKSYEFVQSTGASTASSNVQSKLEAETTSSSSDSDIPFDTGVGEELKDDIDISDFESEFADFEKLAENI